MLERKINNDENKFNEIAMIFHISSFHIFFRLINFFLSSLMLIL